MGHEIPIPNYLCLSFHGLRITIENWSHELVWIRNIKKTFSEFVIMHYVLEDAVERVMLKHV